jgi:hypothetical protein
LSLSFVLLRDGLGAERHFQETVQKGLSMVCRIVEMPSVIPAADHESNDLTGSAIRAENGLKAAPIVAM